MNKNKVKIITYLFYFSLTKDKKYCMLLCNEGTKQTEKQGEKLCKIKGKQKIFTGIFCMK